MPQNALTKRISRRRFLITSGIILGGSCLACTGVGLLVKPNPPQTDIDTPSFTHRKNITMNKQILITYATRTGSTVGVANAIGETLSALNFAVDIKSMKENPPPGDYQAVIMGSAINGAHWLPEAEEYTKNHLQALSHIPIAIFCVHAMNLGEDARSTKWRHSYLNAIRPLVNPVSEAFFAGIGLDPKTTNKIVRKIIVGLFKCGEGDCRDWRKIHAWADSLPSTLL